MANVKNRILLLITAVVLVLSFVFFITPQDVHATDYYIHLKDTLHGSSSDELALVENHEIWFDMDEVCEVDDRLMESYLEGDFEGVKRHDTKDYVSVDMVPDQDGTYRWTPTEDLRGKEVKFYFYCTPNYFISDTYTVEASYDAGEDLVDLRNGTVCPNREIQGPVMPYKETVGIFWTMDAAWDKDGLFDKIEWRRFDDDDNDDMYAEVDLDRDGNKDLYIMKSHLGTEYMEYNSLPTTNIRGDFTIRVSEQTSIYLSLRNEPHFHALTFRFPYITVDLPSASTLTYNGKAQTGVPEGADYTVKGGTATNAGSYTARLSLKDKVSHSWSDGTTEDKEIKWTIKKAANPLSIKPKTTKVKYSKLKKKAQTLAAAKVINFTKQANDKKTYTLVSAKKGSKSFKKYFKINKADGKVTIKKGLKKGTYKVKVKVKAQGDKNYLASADKTVTFTVKVK